MHSIFFTSDPHAGHGNIIKWSHRPFLDVKEDKSLLDIQDAVIKLEKTAMFIRGQPRPAIIEEWRNTRVSPQAVAGMDATLTTRWNSMVGKNDHVYMLGDFSLHKEIDVAAEYLHSLNGKIFAIRGNHDNVMDNLVHQYPEKIEWYKDSFCLRMKGTEYGHIILSHYAFHTWNMSHHGSYHVYGHSHGKLLGSEYDRLNTCTDVGVDCHDFYPVSVEKIEKIMKDKHANL